jgi:hypothetical protein
MSPKNDQIYYSIDEQPEECARAVAGLVKADTSVYPRRSEVPILEVIKIIGMSFLEGFIVDLINSKSPLA